MPRPTVSGLVALHALAVAGGALEVQVTLTSADGRHLFERMPDLTVPAAPPGPECAALDTASIAVDPARQFQAIQGFGATLTGSSAYVISRASGSVRAALLQRLFGPLEAGGIGLSFLRLPIGATDNSVDYSPGHITYDDAAQGDFDLARFSIAPDDDYYLPVLKRILAVNPDVRFVSSPWTAPAWLKTDASQPGAGALQDRPEVYEAYAGYLVRYLEEYKARGVGVAYLTLQNEPGHGGCGPMPCMVVRPRQEARLAAVVRRRLLNSSVPEVKLLAYDHNWGLTPAEHLCHVVAWLLLLSLCCLLLASCGRLLRAGRASSEAASQSRALLSSQEPKEAASEDEPLKSPGSAARCGPWRCLAASLLLTAVLLLALEWVGSRWPSLIPRLFSGMPMGPAFPVEVLGSDPGQDFAGVAWHCYGGDASAMQAVTARFPSRAAAGEHYITECTDVYKPFAEYLGWSQAELFMAGARNGARSVMFWSLASDKHFGPRCHGGACCASCKGVVTVPTGAQSSDELVYNTEFFALAHHSAFLTSGARRIFSAAAGSGVDSVAYQRVDGGLVLVVANLRSTGSVALQVRSGAVSFAFCLPPGVATFLWGAGQQG